MASPPSTKRRTFIALGSTALLTGCLSTDGESTDEQTPTPTPVLDSSLLQQAASRDIPDTGQVIPVPIEAEYLEQGRDRTRDILEQLDERLDEVEDGDVKDEIREVTSRAETALQNSTTAQTASRALIDVRTARADATEAFWTARAALDEVSLDDALDERGQIRDQLQDLRNRNWYIGPGIDTTLVAAYKVEAWTTACEEALSAAETQEAFLDAYRVGKTAERIETARAFLDDASYFVDQLQAGETTDYEAAFEEALESVGSSLSKAVGEIDPKYIEEPEEMFDQDISNASAELISRAAGGTTYHTNWMERYDQRDGVAGALLYAVAGRRDLSLFTDIRAGIEEDGEAYPRLEAADRVDEAKHDIVETITDARKDLSHPFVESFLIRRLALEIGNADHRMKTVLDGDYTDGQIYDAALELWGVPTLSAQRLSEQPTVITTIFEQISGNDQ